MKYSDKLKDPRWQKKRLEILERDKWICQSCGDDKSTLHVHHRRYFPGKDPWDYEDRLLVALCESCHGNEREIRPSYEHDLLEMLKECFFVDDIANLCYGFIGFKPVGVLGEGSHVIQVLLKDKKLQEEVLKRTHELENEYIK